MPSFIITFYVNVRADMLTFFTIKPNLYFLEDRMKRLRLAALLIAAMFIFCVFANLQAAEKYPSRQIELICGFPPGTGPDILNRILARYLEKELGVTVLPINKTILQTTMPAK